MTSTQPAAPSAATPTRVRSAIGTITALMRDNDLGPGDRLPSEAALARDLSVSRPVIREALQSLAAMRLIELKVGRRAVVAGLDLSAMSPLIEHGVQTGQISIQQVYDVRRTIEVRTSALAALRRSDAQGRRIAGHARAMVEARGAPSEVMEHDIAFHGAIAEAAGNPVFALIVGAFEGVTRETWPVGWRSRTDPREQEAMLALHDALATAIVGGDPQEAGTLMRRHFDHSVRALVEAGLS